MENSSTSTSLSLGDLTVMHDPLHQIQQVIEISTLVVFVLLLITFIWGLVNIFIQKNKKPGKKKIIISLVGALILAIIWSVLSLASQTIFAKPVIYLYPEQETKVTVKLDFAGKLIADYPAYDYNLGGWQVIAQPDSTLTNLADGQQYSYLFWEGEAAQPVAYDWSSGFIVKGTDAREFLQKTLADIGLTPREYNEFIVYWYPKLAANEYNLIHFATPEEYDVYAPLTITPQPDNLLRVFMVFRPLSDPTAIVPPTPQTFPNFTRTGFTVVEWGGSEVR